MTERYQHPEIEAWLQESEKVYEAAEVSIVALKQFLEQTNAEILHPGS